MHQSMQMYTVYRGESLDYLRSPRDRDTQYYQVVTLREDTILQPELRKSMTISVYYQNKLFFDMERDLMYCAFRGNEDFSKADLIASYSNARNAYYLLKLLIGENRH